MYICIYMFVYVYIYVCVYSYIYIYVCVIRIALRFGGASSQVPSFMNLPSFFASAYCPALWGVRDMGLGVRVEG